MLEAFFLVVLGIALLYAGGELLIASSIRIARSFGLSRMVIGLTVVAFATSSPELAATLTAAFDGSPDIAVGNVFGSNVANLGLILGVAALLFPLPTTVRFIRREVAFMVAVTVLVYPLMWTGLYLGRLEGLFLVILLVVFVLGLVRDPESQQIVDEIPDHKPWPLWQSSLGVVGGIGFLVGGARALVAGAREIASTFGIGELVIGLTLVALGTSLPELAATVAAARRREVDLVLGNVIGSNIFNLLCILGITTLAHPLEIEAHVLRVDFWVMLGISVLVLVILAIQRRVTQLEGAGLLLIYLVYAAILLRPPG